MYMNAFTEFASGCGYFYNRFSVLLINGFKVDGLIIILLQRGRLSPSIPRFHDAPGNHVIGPFFSPDASSDNKEETGNTAILTSN